MQIKKYIKIFIGIIIAIFIYIAGINTYVVLKTKNEIIKDSDNTYDAILVLGCAVWGNQPSPMLQDRLDSAIQLYEKGIAPIIVMSGDHTTENHDEVNIMKDYAISMGVPSEDIYMDHAGISTYDSIYRAKYIFNLDNIVVVTQKYHLFRSLYISQSIGMNASGYSADVRRYTKATFREAREVLARNKDFLKSLFKPKASVMGEAILTSGSGDITNDK